MADQHRIVLTFVETRAQKSRVEADKMFDLIVASLSRGTVSPGFEAGVEQKIWDVNANPPHGGWITIRVYPSEESASKKIPRTGT